MDELITLADEAMGAILANDRDTAKRWPEVCKGLASLRAEAMAQVGSNDPASTKVRRAFAELRGQLENLSRLRIEDVVGCMWAADHPELYDIAYKALLGRTHHGALPTPLACYRWAKRKDAAKLKDGRKQAPKLAVEDAAEAVAEAEADVEIAHDIAAKQTEAAHVWQTRLIEAQEALAAARVRIEELEAENDGLKVENAGLKARIAPKAANAPKAPPAPAAKGKPGPKPRADEAGAQALLSQIRALKDGGMSWPELGKVLGESPDGPMRRIVNGTRPMTAEKADKWVAALDAHYAAPKAA